MTRRYGNIHSQFPPINEMYGLHMQMGATIKTICTIIQGIVPFSSVRYLLHWHFNGPK